MLKIGIDQSFSATGVVAVEDKTIRTMKIISAPGKNETPTATVIRAKYIADGIIDFIDTTTNDRKIPFSVCIEGLGFGAKGNATRDLAMLQGIILSVLIEHGMTPSVIPPTQLKKHATGDGGRGIGKEQMFDALPCEAKLAIGEYKKTKGRYDLTDAYFLATCL